MFDRLFFAIIAAPALCSLLQAQNLDSTMHNPTTSRLKAIYEDRAFRPKPARVEWFPDSSGYTLWQHDADAKKQVAASYDIQTGQSVESPQSGDPHEGERVSPDGKRIIEFRDRNLFVKDRATDERTQLTDRPNDRDIFYREPEWSPDGKHVVFVESDETGIRKRAVLVPEDPTYPGVEHHRFARVGGKIAKLRVGVVDAAGNQVLWLSIADPDEDFYLGQLSWAGDSEVLIEKLSRYRDQREFLLCDLDGEVKQIYQETNPAWAIHSQGKNLGLNWVQDGQAFIVVTEKDGWRHAYLYSRDGKELAQLTPGEYDIIDKSAIDEESGWYYFYASPENGTQQYLYRVPLDGSGKLERITPDDQPGWHEYEFAPDAKWAIHTYSTIDSPPIVNVVEIEGHRSVRVLEDNQQLRQKMNQLIAQPTEFLQLNIGDGVSMDAVLLKPRDFNESKKYPVLVYVYGEPHLQTVLDRWGAGQVDFHRVIADQGYLVVSIDNRGTPAPKGAAWRRAAFGSLGPLSTEDQAAGLKELGRMCPYVDLSRVAIWGWSGGGSNTLNAMFRKPELYHVGIAVVPKPQPHLYNAWFQEIYMRDREVNNEGYERSAPINFAEGLKGDLLIITGSGETNTHMQIIEGLVDRLIEMGKPFDYMVYPNRNHGLAEGKGTLVHVRAYIIRYLMDHLPAGPK